MIEKRKYSIKREENGEQILNLKIKLVDGKISIKDKINNFVIEGLTIEEVNEKLHEFNVSEVEKIEIKKALLLHDVPKFRTKQQLLNEKLDNSNEMSDEFREYLDQEYQEIRQDMEDYFNKSQREIDELEERMKQYFM